MILAVVFQVFDIVDKSQRIVREFSCIYEDLMNVLRHIIESTMMAHDDTYFTHYILIPFNPHVQLLNNWDNS